MYTIPMIIEKLNLPGICVLKNISGDHISSVRIKTDPAMKENTLYIEPAEKNGMTCCETLKGSSFLYPGNTTSALNHLLEVMDYYTAWENNLISASRRGCTLTELLDIAYPALNLPLIILDNNEWMVAYSYDLDLYGPQINRDLSDMMQFRSSSVEKVAAYNRDYSYYFKRTDVYRIPGDIFTTNNAYAFNLYHDKQFVGVLITDFIDTPVTEGRLDLFELLGYHILEMLNDSVSGLSIGSPEFAFVHFLRSPSPDTQNELDRELVISSWKAGDPMQIIYMAPPINKGLSPNPNHVLTMFNRIFGVKAAEYMEGIFLLVNKRLLSENTGYNAFLEKIIQLSYCAGISSTFSEITQIPVMARRAQAALDHGDKNAGAVNYFDEHFLDCFFSLMQTEDMDILRHPLPDRLKDYDKRFGSRLYDTLFVYLKNERSIADTAREMQLHRNTLIHRIERIDEISQGVLDEPETRLRILLSYYMKQPEDR